MDFSFLSDPRYNLLGAFWMTVQLTFWSAIGSFVLGVLLAAMRVSPVPLLRGFAGTWVNVIRNIPLTLIIIVMAQVIANQLGVRLAQREAGVNPQVFLDNQNFRLAVVGFIIYTSTFVCEAVRAGINTVPPGQAEAARAIGLKFTQVLGIVVLPQAVRAVIAPLGSVLIALTKNTTVASAIGVAEVALLMNTLIENEADKLTAVFIVVAAGFIVLTLPTGLFFGWLAKRKAVRR
ncbi:amino acid ABC transporter permease [Nakamurella flava]|uniref:Amino acid ABC transporter permease n=2 Tax=Nakamurella flava TaxID=2576308 RepID=A0A4V6CSM1_9ACTN|nr:amino acid ABC transporter permease [Nakamurella flava]TKV56125.1 amino acid ABC transporter permease [Nakamurella flava]